MQVIRYRLRGSAECAFINDDLNRVINKKISAKDILKKTKGQLKVAPLPKLSEQEALYNQLDRFYDWEGKQDSGVKQLPVLHYAHQVGLLLSLELLDRFCEHEHCLLIFQKSRFNEDNSTSKEHGKFFETDNSHLINGDEIWVNVRVFLKEYYYPLKLLNDEAVRDELIQDIYKVLSSNSDKIKFKEYFPSIDKPHKDTRASDRARAMQLALHWLGNSIFYLNKCITNIPELAPDDPEFWTRDNEESNNDSFKNALTQSTKMGYANICIITKKFPLMSVLLPSAVTAGGGVLAPAILAPFIGTVWGSTFLGGVASAFGLSVSVAAAPIIGFAVVAGGVTFVGVEGAKKLWGSKPTNLSDKAN